MDEQFSTEVAQVDGATVIHVRGEIDMATCERLRDAIEPHLGPNQTIILDLSGCSSWVRRASTYRKERAGN